ncbi:MAG: hypothetical protein LBS83_01585 [Holosporales bacterium]|jgi:hypothetical protein|nr:hypothetical protein [Holosporales bacterium]
MQTDLTLSIGGLPPMSARGCVQELKPIAQGVFKRTINGELIFVGNADHKYTSTIKCSDAIPLATEGLQIGTQICVGCIQLLCQKIESGTKTVVLERDVVPGSVQVFDENNQNIDDFSVENRTIFLNNQQQKERFVSYNPLLNMRVVSFSLLTDEWNMKSWWTLELEEV